MSILDKLFKKRQPKTNSIPFTELESATDGFKVVLKTEKNLSEEQRNTIITIVKNGMASNSEPSDICINIMMSTGIYDVMILNRIENGVEVIF